MATFSIFISSAGSNQIPQDMNEIDQTEIAEKLEDLPDWLIENQALCRNYQFENFVEAINFVNLLVEPAEKLQHHPDISIIYNQVKICLTTHDAGGITEKDWELARIIAQLYQEKQKK